MGDFESTQGSGNYSRPDTIIAHINNDRMQITLCAAMCDGIPKGHFRWASHPTGNMYCVGRGILTPTIICIR